MQPNLATLTTIDQYIACFPIEIQVILTKIRETISNAAPGAVESISYQMPTFKLKGNLVHFAAYKNHIGFYPAPSGIEAFKKEIALYKWAKGSVQFPIEKPIPLNLIAEIVRFRVIENMEKSAAKKK
jgi:uncharacterized protein YdhG (YjbR/CyaY superfamily)